MKQLPTRKCNNTSCYTQVNKIRLYTLLKLGGVKNNLKHEMLHHEEKESVFPETESK